MAPKPGALLRGHLKALQGMLKDMEKAPAGTYAKETFERVKCSIEEAKDGLKSTKVENVIREQRRRDKK